MYKKRHPSVIDTQLKLGKNIEKFRKERGLLREVLADILEISTASLVAFEKGTRNMQPYILLRICAVLECTPNDLLPPVPEIKLVTEDIVMKKIISAKFV